MYQLKSMIRNICSIVPTVCLFGAILVLSTGVALAGMEDPRPPQPTRDQGETLDVERGTKAIAAVVEYDNGSTEPAIDTGWPMSAWVLAEDFELSGPATLTGAFVEWFETPPYNWDGQIQWYIFADNGGSPGTLLHQGAGKDVSTVLFSTHNGWRWYQTLVEFDSGVALAPGTRYWLGFHWAAPGDFTPSNVYWATTQIGGFGTPGQQSHAGTFDNWISNDDDHMAFKLLSGAIFSPAYAVADDTDSFYSVDLQTGVASLIGPCNYDLSLTGLAWDSLSHTMYVSDVRLSDGFFGLGSVDINTGAVTEIGRHVNSSNIHALAFDSINDILYGSDTQCSGLATVDRTTGESNCIGPWGASSDIIGLAFNSGTGTLYGVDPINLYTIDSTTGAATVVGPHGAGLDGDVIGLEYDAWSRTLYGAGVADGILYTIDMGSGAATPVGSTGLGWVSGLASTGNPRPAEPCGLFCGGFESGDTTLWSSTEGEMLPLVGAFLVNDGPPYETNPPVYSCLDACALLFGGVPGNYQCSTSDVVIDNMANASTWGAPCGIVAEDYSLDQGSGYDCGFDGCATSAYVGDNCFLGETNYCWQ